MLFDRKFVASSGIELASPALHEKSRPPQAPNALDAVDLTTVLTASFADHGSVDRKAGSVESRWANSRR
jgi:hypothetical protein